MFKNNLPNFLTCCNLICGCFGIVFCLEGNSIPAAYFVWAAAIFDFFDGFVARILKVHSPIGKELDSLADMVSFGLLPSMVMYKMISQSTGILWLPYLAFIIAIFSALRLAIFNVDETQRDSFKGLNTPANTLFITSLPLLNGQVGAWLYQDWLLITITIVFSLLMVSPVTFISFKFKTIKWSENRSRFTFLLLSVFLFIFFTISAVPLIILFYIVTSFISQAIGFEKK